MAAAGFEDALQELGAGLVAAAFAAGAFGFGFDEAAFDGGFEDGGFVALEVGLDALEVGDGFVEAGELFFDFRDDAFLLVQWWMRDPKCSDVFGPDGWIQRSLNKLRHFGNEMVSLDCVIQPARLRMFVSAQDMEPGRPSSTLFRVSD